VWSKCLAAVVKRQQNNPKSSGENLGGSDWVDKIKAAATKIVTKFGDARWYIGSQLKKNKDGLWAM
jgi:hypothetical protein